MNEEGAEEDELATITSPAQPEEPTLPEPPSSQPEQDESDVLKIGFSPNPSNNNDSLPIRLC